MNVEEAIEIVTNAVQTGSLTVERDRALAVVQKTVEKVVAGDVVPVVRCKDCEHWGTRKVDGYGFCCIWGTSVKEDAFCSSGVKRRADNDP